MYKLDIQAAVLRTVEHLEAVTATIIVTQLTTVAQTLSVHVQVNLTRTSGT